MQPGGSEPSLMPNQTFHIFQPFIRYQSMVSHVMSFTPHYKKFACRMGNTPKMFEISDRLFFFYFLFLVIFLVHVLPDLRNFISILDQIGAWIIGQKLPFSGFWPFFHCFDANISKKFRCFEICAICYWIYDFKSDKQIRKS